MNLARHFSSQLKNGQVGVTRSVCSATDGRRPWEALRPGVMHRWPSWWDAFSLLCPFLPVMVREKVSGWCWPDLNATQILACLTLQQRSDRSQALSLSDTNMETPFHRIYFSQSLSILDNEWYMLSITGSNKKKSYLFNNYKFFKKMSLFQGKYLVNNNIKYSQKKNDDDVKKHFIRST